jgi:UDP-GlcNAc:undecaprenyl-phosphate GlcNAc-1-phosphate transferase
MAVICILVATQIFGLVEFVMLASRVKSLGVSLMGNSRGNRSWHSSFRLQGTRQWDLLWQSLTEYAERAKLADMKLDINMAALQEEYHASWRRRVGAERRELWRTEIPLYSGNHVVGRLTLSGGRESEVLICELIGRLMDDLTSIESEIASLTSVLDPVAPLAKAVPAGAIEAPAVVH